jgi:hypothetical protein
MEGRAPEGRQAGREVHPTVAVANRLPPVPRTGECVCALRQA